MWLPPTIQFADHLQFIKPIFVLLTDVVLGNPPWGKVKLQEKGWFAARRPDISAAPNAAARKRMINSLVEDDLVLHAAFRDDLRRSDGVSHFLHVSGRYPLCGKGDINTYAMFAETNRYMLSPSGWVGCIVPSGIATDDTTKEFFAKLVNGKCLASFYDFENRKGIFPTVQRNIRFCLLTFSSTPLPYITVAAQLDDPNLLRDQARQYVLSADDIRRINPNTMNMPTLRSARDAELVKEIYRRNPILINETGEEDNHWGIKFSTMFHMANDSNLFRTYEELDSESWVLIRNSFYKDGEVYTPLYEAKLAGQYNHRAATFNGIPPSERFKLHAGTNTPSVEDLCDRQYAAIP